MIVNLYLLLFAIAAILTLFVIVAGTQGHVGGLRVDTRTAVVLSGFAFILWGYIAVSSFELTVHSGGSEFTQSYPGVAFLAAAGGAVSIYCLFQATVHEIDTSGGI